MGTKELQIQPNEHRCSEMQESHILRFQHCCPMSRNPQKGSQLTISYTPADNVLEVAALKNYIDSYVGGRGPVRSMEGMIQNIAKDCAEILKVEVEVVAELLINPGGQGMKVVCKHRV